MTANSGILPMNRAGVKSFPASQANFVQEEAQQRAKAVAKRWPGTRR